VHTLNGMIRSMNSQTITGKRGGTAYPLPRTDSRHEYRLEFVPESRVGPYTFALQVGAVRS